MRMRWLGTAGFEMRSGETFILIDPYLTRNAEARPQQSLTPQDLSHALDIFVTHGHFDHTFDLPAIVEASGARVHASASVCDSVSRKGVPPEKIEVMGEGESAVAGPFLVTAVPTCHVSFDARLVATTAWRCLPILPTLARLGTRNYPKGDVLGWLVEVEGRKLFHLGSGCMKRDLTESVETLLIPVQGRTDICRVAAELAERVHPDIIIPHHHDDFYPPLSKHIDLEPFLEELERLGVKAEVRVPEIDHWIEM
ncbi:MAG: MBL fold metallo-hydrolase [Actinomycetota bacterium]|nr:MBL fold metallo-hydrolase [Actinomycetota bacterium]